MTDAARVRNGVLAYAQSEVLPNLPAGKQFLAGIALGMLGARFEKIMQSLTENGAAKLLGIVGEDGMIDVDAVYEAARAQFSKQGNVEIDVPMLGVMRFGMSDLDALRRNILGQ